MALMKISTTVPSSLIFDFAIPIVVAGASATQFTIAKDGGGVGTVDVAAGGFGTTGALAAAARIELGKAVERGVADPYVIPNVASIIASDDAYLAPDDVVLITAVA